MISCDLVKRRLEIKHLLSATAAARARARLLAVRPGGEVRCQTGGILTTYLDLPDRRLALRAVERPDDNVKVRLREYFDGAGLPVSPFVWVEVKAREGPMTRKSRFPMLRTRVGRLLEGRLQPSQLTAAEDPDEAAETLRRIRGVGRGALAAVGTVRYRRTSIQGGDPAARLTLDEGIVYQAGTASRSEAAAVLEVKHAEERLPAWCRAVLGPAAPAEYSKFRVLALLALAEASAA